MTAPDDKRPLCQECGKALEDSPFAFVIADAPHARICLACRRRIDPRSASPVNQISDTHPTLVTVSLDQGEVLFSVIFAVGPLEFQRQFPRVSSILFPA